MIFFVRKPNLYQTSNSFVFQLEQLTQMSNLESGLFVLSAAKEALWRSSVNGSRERLRSSLTLVKSSISALSIASSIK